MAFAPARRSDASRPRSLPAAPPRDRILAAPLPESPLPAGLPPVADVPAAAGQEREAERVAARAEERVPRPCSCGGHCPRCAGKGVSGGLDPAARAVALAVLGEPFGEVHLHADAQAADAARRLGARAFTVGRDILFGRGQYRPDTPEGRRLLVHELTHVRQQRSGPARIQRDVDPNLTPATDADRREFIRETIRFLNDSADFYAEPQVTLDATLFETLINNWYRIAVNQERIIDADLAGDAILKRDLRAAYTAAIRVLMSRAATVLGRSETDLYRANSGRIPLWAWPTAHHMETGISTPVAAGRSADPFTGEVGFASNGFQITLLPDTTDAALGNRAKTEVDVDWGQVHYQWTGQGGQRIVTSFTGPGTPTARIQTTYGSGVTAGSTSGYGRGTTAEDVAGGAVSPRSTTLGFHEGSHGLAFVEYLEGHPPPAFTGALQMTETAFLAARDTWLADARRYVAALNAFSTSQVDCVGTTIDQFNQANAAPGAQVVLECGP